ncbi:MAG: MFS transporter [Chloroflexi bacterium]|nr:MFS transporter [Chloroflexota bacterium]
MESDPKAQNQDQLLVNPPAPLAGPDPVPAQESYLSRLKNYIFKGGKALRHRNYRLFWTGQLVSLIGTWMQNLAQSWLVLTLSNNDPFALGLVAGLQFLPTLLFSLFTGVIADRYSKHRILLITQSSSMAVAALLGVLTVGGWVQLWHVYLCALALGMVNALDMPTRQSFVSEMVGKDDLMNAVALNSTIFNAARVVGPAVAGLLIGLGEAIFRSTEAGVALAIWLNAFSYIAVIIGLLKMDTSKLFQNSRKRLEGSVFKNLGEGLSFIWHTPSIATLIIVVGMVGTFGFNFNVWIPVIAREILKVGADGYGILMAGLGLGALFSSLYIAVNAKNPNHRNILIATAWFAFFEAGVALSGNFFLTLFFMVGTGLAMIQVSAATNTYVQMNTPDHLRGRVMSVYMLVFAGTTPFGSVFVGWLSSAGGTPFSMFTSAVLSGLAVPIALLYYRRNHNYKRAGRAVLTPTPEAAPSTEQ